MTFRLLILIICALAQPIALAQSNPPGRNCVEPSRIGDLLDGYLQAYRDRNDWSQIRYKAAISRSLFPDPQGGCRELGKDEYQATLARIDARASTDPEAIAKLAYSLQLRWGRRYPAERPDRLSYEYGRIGASVGAYSAWGTVAVAFTAILAAGKLRPDALPKLFAAYRLLRTWRWALPFAGAAAGAGIGKVAGAIEGRSAPPAPAEVMKLGLERDDEYEFGPSQWVDVLAPSAVPLAAADIAYFAATGLVHAIRAANGLTVPLKWNPLAIVASLAAYVATEEMMNRWIDHRQFERLSDPVFADAAEVISGMGLKPALALVRRAERMSAYLREPLTSLLSDYSEGRTKLARKARSKGWSEAELSKRLSKLDGKLLDSYYEYLGTLGDEEDRFVREYDGYRVRELLLSGRKEELRSLDGYSQVLAREYVASGADLRKIGQDRDAALAREVAGADFGHHPERVLLQSAALLRSQGNPMDRELAEELMDEIGFERQALETWIELARAESLGSRARP